MFICRYELEVVRVDRGTTFSISVVAQTEHNITTLLPNVEYRVRVRPVTRGYSGVWSSAITDRTTNTGMCGRSSVIYSFILPY